MARRQVVANRLVKHLSVRNLGGEPAPAVLAVTAHTIALYLVAPLIDHIIVAGPFGRGLAAPPAVSLVIKLGISVQENEMTTVPKVTREVLESYLHCKSKGLLKLSREHGTKSDYEVWRLDLTARQQSEAVGNLVMRYPGHKIAADVPLTAATMEAGPQVILDGTFENELISLSVDALVKTEAPATQGQSHYIPVLFHDDEIRTSQKTLLECFALIISEVLETEPTVGLVCHSKGRPTTIRLTPGLRIARRVFSELKDLHQGLRTPMLVLNNHCQVCEFYDRCRGQALKADNLSLLRGMNELQITRLNSKGIFTVNQLSYTFKMRRRPKRAKHSAAGHYFPLRALALREKKIFVHGNPDMPLAATRIYLDIEGTPQSRSYYLIGIITISGVQESHDTYWADTTSMSDQIRIFVSLLDHLNQYSEYRLLHFGSYETVALKRIQHHMAEPYKRHIENALNRSINILSVISAHIYFPTYSNSLKEIGGFLGCQWSDPSSSGVQTLVWRDRWLTNREPFLKAKLVRYNYDDCIALKGVVEFVEEILAAGPCGSLRHRKGTEIVPTSALAAERDSGSLYAPTGFALDDFRTINEHSYFDYQRDRVFARTGRPGKRAIVKPKRNLPAPNKILTLRAAKCPSCHSRELKARSQTVHEVADLRFMPGGGVKRWTTRYVTWRYRCTHCGCQFVPTAFQRHRKLPKYGRGLISWCLYQLLIGGQNINRVHRSLLELFGLQIPNGSVYLFKRAAAAYFNAGYQKILEDLQKGGLINIDETTINLQKDKGYVWVMASTTSVYFFYKPSREGSFLADFLRKFKGVLVSDFYTAYDSLAMPQQRCLIHLMRDMNEDLLKHPFHDELKSIASRFSSLMRAIVNTIDRYGLKKRHLNKHRAHAERFCNWAVAGDFGSEAATNYVRRIIKYSKHLFAF